MKLTILLLLCLMAGSAQSKELGNLLQGLDPIQRVAHACDRSGHFMYYGTLYLCTKIREDVTKADIDEFVDGELDRLERLYKERANYRKHNSP